MKTSSHGPSARLGQHLRSLLAHPLTRDLDLDDPGTTRLRQRIIREKSFLRHIYEEWYEQILSSIPGGPGRILELGSGAGFMRDRLSEVITSDLIASSGTDLVMDGLSLPIGDEMLRAIVMVDVLHHIAEPRRFFAEAGRCVRPNGVVVMIEPWVTPWSSFVYRNLHHEPFQPEVPHWEFPGNGPLSSANGALPWILFERDRARFSQEFPQWRIEEIELGMPFRYLVSGGVSLRTLMPGWSFGLWRGAERMLKPWMGKLGMFARIKLVRRL